MGFEPTTSRICNLFVDAKRARYPCAKSPYKARCKNTTTEPPATVVPTIKSLLLSTFLLQSYSNKIGKSVGKLIIDVIPKTKRVNALSPPLPLPVWS